MDEYLSLNAHILSGKISIHPLHRAVYNQKDTSSDIFVLIKLNYRSQKRLLPSHKLVDSYHPPLSFSHVNMEHLGDLHFSSRGKRKRSDLAAVLTQPLSAAVMKCGILVSAYDESYPT